MNKPDSEGLKVLRHALCANGPRKFWGTRNSYTAATMMTPKIRQLVKDGWLVAGPEVRPGVTEYRATFAGMREIGMGSAAIERARNLQS